MRMSDWSSDVSSSDLSGPGGRSQQIQEYHASQGRAGQEALRHVLETQPRNHRRRENGHGRSGHEPASAPRDQRRQGAVHAQGDRQSVVEGKSVSVRVDLGGRRLSKNKKLTKQKE